MGAGVAEDPGPQLVVPARLGGALARWGAWRGLLPSSVPTAAGGRERRGHLPPQLSLASAARSRAPGQDGNCGPGEGTALASVGGRRVAKAGDSRCSRDRACSSFIHQAPNGVGNRSGPLPPPPRHPRTRHPVPGPQQAPLTPAKAAGLSMGQLASLVTRSWGCPLPAGHCGEAGRLRHAAGSAHCGRAGEALTSPRSPAHRSREL